MSQPDTWTPEEADRLGRIARGDVCPHESAIETWAVGRLTPDYICYSCSKDLTCVNCQGSGVEAAVELDCCGNYLDSGECCAAIHGTANLVPVQTEEQCGQCGGKGHA